MVRPAASSHGVNVYDINQLAHVKEQEPFVRKRAVSKVSEMPQQLFGQRAARVNPADLSALSRNGTRPRPKGCIRVENQGGLLDRHFDEFIQLINSVQVGCVNGHRKSKNSWPEARSHQPSEGVAFVADSIAGIEHSTTGAQLQSSPWGRNLGFTLLE